MVTFNKGLVKKTDNQEKWLFKQLSKKQRMHVLKLAKTLNVTTTFSKHVIDKINNDNVTISKQLLKELYQGKYNVIEYNVTNGRERIVTRSKSFTTIKVSGKNTRVNLCMVYQPIDNTVITMYYNDINDNHITLDLKRYSKNFQKSS